MNKSLSIFIIFNPVSLVYNVISPEKPVNASAISPARINDIGSPLNGRGTSATSSFSRILAIMIRASPKPIPEPSANAILSIKL